MKKLLYILAASFIVALISWTTPPAPDDGPRGSEIFDDFSLDTLTNGDTINFTVPDRLGEAYFGQWQVHVTNLSGTTGGTAYVQTSSSESGDYWTTVDSWAFSATGDTILVNTEYGIRARLRVISSGTQSTQINAAVTYKQQE